MKKYISILLPRLSIAMQPILIVLPRLSIAMLLTSIAVPLFAQNIPLQRMIERMITMETDIDFEKTPGLAIGVIEGDSTYTFGLGSIYKGKNVRPDGETIFEIGSITKTFTVTLLAQAVKEGKMDWQQPLQNYMPEGFTLPTFQGQPIRVVDVATHASGLPKYPFYFGTKATDDNNPYKHYSVADEKEFLSNYILTTAPNTTYSYSHLAYDLLAKALVNVYKAANYDALVSNKLLNSLNINDTRVTLAPLQKTRLAQGYSLMGEAVPLWEFASFEGSLGLKSTTNDLLKWLRFQIDASPDWQPLLSPLYAIQRDSDYPIAKAATGWFSVKTKRGYPNMVVHSGNTDGFRSYIAFIPQTRTGVVILSNSEHPTNGLGMIILQMINQNWKLKKTLKRTKRSK